MESHTDENSSDASELLRAELSMLLHLAHERGIDLDALRDYSSGMVRLGALDGIEHVDGMDVSAERARADALMRDALARFPSDVSRSELRAFATGWAAFCFDSWGEGNTIYMLRCAAFHNGILVGMTLGAVSDGAGKFARRMLARDAASAMRHKNPRFAMIQAARNEAEVLWQERHAGKHPKLRTNEQFAAECMRRWPALTSAKVILGWCTTWNKAAKARKPQPAS